MRTIISSSLSGSVGMQQYLCLELIRMIIGACHLRRQHQDHHSAVAPFLCRNQNGRSDFMTARPDRLGEVETDVHPRSEEHTSELQSHLNLVCRLLLEKKKSN